VKAAAAQSETGHSIFGWALRILAIGVVCCLLRWLLKLLTRVLPKEPLPDFEEGPSESKPLLDEDEDEDDSDK